MSELQEVPQEDLPEAPVQSGSEVPEEDLPEGSSGSEVPLHDLHTGSGDQSLAGLEGVARGASAGLSDALASGMRSVATKAGLPEEYLHYVAPAPEDIAARQHENPITSTGAEIAGSFGLLNSLPKIGSTFVNTLIKSGILAGGDELSKAMLGEGDPSTAVASHIAGTTAINLLTDGLFGKAEKLGSSGLKAIENSKIGSKLSSMLTGMGHAASFPGDNAVSLANSALTEEERSGLSDKSFQVGQKLYNTYAGKVPSKIGSVIAPAIGGMIGGWGGLGAGYGLEKTLESVAPGISSKYIGPALLKAAASGSADKAGDILDHATKIQRGAGRISNGIKNIFEATGNKAVEPVVNEKDREKLRKYIDGGAFNNEIRDEAQQQRVPTQSYAEGGEVSGIIQKPSAVAQIYPEQNTLLASTKGRVANYLGSIKPRPSEDKKLYDSKQNDPQKESEYNRVLDMANQPLSILNHVKSGTLLPKHMKHFTSMYPELHQHLSKKLTERMMQDKLDDNKKPPYKTRQALSLFLGTDLDSSLSQPNMAAAQSVFTQQNAQKGVPSNKSELKNMSKSAMTADQGREARSNKD